MSCRGRCCCSAARAPARPSSFFRRGPTEPLPPRIQARFSRLPVHFGRMLTVIALVFAAAYAAIALEHPLGVNKSASALIGAGLLWTLYAMLSGNPHTVGEQLGETVSGTAQIVFFLIGAMTI